MHTLTEKVFLLAPPGGLFDETVVTNLFPDHLPGARKALVHRAIAAGEILRLLPGLFCLAPPFRKSQPHPFTVASMLHTPSQISLETALAFHGLIPEAVHEVASVTPDRGRTFRTPLGVFSFLRVPTRVPRAGVRAVEVTPGMWAFVASPLRAIADLVYSRKAVSWECDGTRFLTDSLRIDLDELNVLAVDADEVLGSMQHQRTREYLSGLREVLDR